MHTEVSKTNSLDLDNFVNVNVKVNINWNTRRDDQDQRCPNLFLRGAAHPTRNVTVKVDF